MTSPITKSDFLRYLDCPAYFWFFKKKPEVLTEQELSEFDKELIKNGKEVEIWARKLFPSGVLVKSRETAAVKETQELINEENKAIFQATFQAENLYAMVDILEWDESHGHWVINEVKATSSKEKKKEEQLNDATFQYIVAKKAGLDVGRVNLIELNKEFRKHGEIKPRELLQITDITEKVKELEKDVQLLIPGMQQMIENKREPLPCDCIYKSRNNHCPAFKYLYPEVPDYSVHDIVRIGNSLKRLKALIEDDYYAMEDVPEDFKLTPYQRNQVQVAQTKIPIIKLQEIQEKLDELEYPLYFLDYETYPTAVPIYDGCAPYQQVPFQFSLHVLREPHEALEHYEYLHTDADTHPMIALANSLTKMIGKEGNIIVWNKKFEGMCHKDLADLLPQYAEIFLGYNQRFFDLMEIFSKNLYVHHDFNGGYSIKDVLPVLVPEMTYANLNVRDGSMAMNAWKKMMFETITEGEKEQLKKDLLEYCKLDTLAMVKIFEVLEKPVEKVRIIHVPAKRKALKNA